MESLLLQLHLFAKLDINSILLIENAMKELTGVKNNYRIIVKLANSYLYYN